MFEPPNEYSKKRQLLVKIFADSADKRVDFFCKQLSLKQLENLAELRNMVYENGQTKPHALNNYHLILSKHGATKSPEKETNEFDAIFDLIVKGKKKIDTFILSHPITLQRKNISRFSGAGGLSALIIAMIIFMYSILINCAIETDRKLMDDVKRNEAKGLCVREHMFYVDAEGAEDDYIFWRQTQKGSEKDIDCHDGNHVLYLTLISAIMSRASLWLYDKIQEQKLFKSMLAVCNDSKYDSLLNEILLDRSPDVNWSEKIRVNGTLCSLRQLALSLLLCFDDRMYAELLPNFAKQLKTGEPEISLAHEGVEINIKRVASVREKYMAHDKPRF